MATAQRREETSETVAIPEFRDELNLLVLAGLRPLAWGLAGIFAVLLAFDLLATGAPTNQGGEVTKTAGASALSGSTSRISTRRSRPSSRRS